MIVNENGAVQRLFSYDIYGVPTIVSVDPNDDLAFYNLFTGQYYDAEIELYNYNARFYDPTLARFLQIDPLHQGFSSYVYVGDMPDEFTDPSGEVFGIDDLIVGLAVSAIIGAVIGSVMSVSMAAASGARGNDLGKAFGIGLFTGAVSGMVGFGVGTGVTAGLGSLSASVATTGSSLAAKTAVIGAIGGALGGAAAGGSDQVVRNVLQGDSLFNNMGMSIGISAGIGLVTGGVIGLALGRSLQANSSLLQSGRTGGNTMGVGISHELSIFAHSIVGIRGQIGAAKKGFVFYQLLDSSSPGPLMSSLLGRSSFLRQITGKSASTAHFWRSTGNLDETRGRFIGISLSQKHGAKALKLAKTRAGDIIDDDGAYSRAVGDYDLINNSCISHAIDVLEAARLSVPAYARTPTTLRWWMGQLSQAQKRMPAPIPDAPIAAAAAIARGGRGARTSSIRPR